MGENLASVHSAGEYHTVQRVVVSQTNSYPETWLGASDYQEEGTWFWSDGSPFYIGYWCSGEPNNDRGQHCLHMNYGSGKCCDDLWCHLVMLHLIPKLQSLNRRSDDKTTASELA
ncbi:hypothetical protein LDENG_00244160 [Lucifuga dentata]|nr:hypothetical protein LDENG_00244160 [Lucifuga dentata]